jgi:molybdenum cofactor cytidylyltransferase
LSRGHILSEEDVRLLAGEGLEEVWVTELEEGEVGEDEAVMEVAGRVGCGSVEIRLAAGGRANLLANEDCCVLVDDGLLRELNAAPTAVVATLANFTHARLGQRIATVKSVPFAVPRRHLEAVLGTLRDRGPVLQARPIRNASVGVLYSDPITGERAKQLFESVMRQRLERFGVRSSYALAVNEEEPAVARGLEHLLRSHPCVVLVASTTAPAGPEDVVGSAMTRIGCALERFLAPVEPGNLLLLGYKGETPIMSAPGCFRSAKANVVDLLLPPLLARYKVSSWEVASLGHGGLIG